MKNKIVALFILFVLLFFISINAQEKEKQTEQKITLPQLYLEQKLDQTVMNFCLALSFSAAYVKTLGKTPEDLGKFIGEAVTPGWKEVKGKGIAPFINGMYINLHADKNFKMEILEESKTSVKARMNRMGEAVVKAYSETGVTLEEYDRCFGKTWETIANYLGLDYKQNVEGEWIVFTVTEKPIK